MKICLVALSRRAGLATVEASGKGPAFSALTMTSLACRNCRGETEDCSGAGGLGLARPGPLKDPGRTVAWAWCMCARVCVYVCVHAVCEVASVVQLFVTPWAVAHQAPLSMGILQARVL